MSQKIKLLLIDDSPFSKSEPPGSDKFSSSLLKSFLGINDDEVDLLRLEDYGFPLLNVNLTGKYKGFLDYFDIRWLYSTSSIKDYLNLTNLVEDNFGSLVLGLEGYVPDIVIFDYALTGHEENQPRGFRLNFVRKRLDPNFDLIQALGKRNGQIKFTPTTRNYPWIDSEGNSDRFGLYAGGILVERFRHDTPCFGIPATYWSSIMLEKTEAGYFEWLLQDAFRNVFDNPALKGKTEQKKSWEDIIDIAMPQYRQSLLDLIKLNKIQVDLNVFISLLGGALFNKREGAFTFNSIYGLRKLSLDGLFVDIDIIPAIDIPPALKAISGDYVITIRDVAIWNFLQDILQILLQEADPGGDFNNLRSAVENAHKLITVFDSPDFKRRLLLSHYCGKIQREGKEALKEKEREIYEDCLLYFSTLGDQITFPDEFTITQLAQSNKMFNRLVVFFVAAILWERYESYIKSLKDDPTYSYNQLEGPAIAFLPPARLDLLLALFPIWTNNVVLFTEKGGWTKEVTDAMTTRFNTLCEFKHTKIPEDNGIDPRRNMTYGEFVITKAFATGLNSSITPFWLKSYEHETA